MTFLGISLGLVFLIYSSQGFLFHENKCYEDLGCFDNGHPYQNALGEVPDSPQEIQTSLNLFTRKNPTQAQVLPYNDVKAIEKTNFDPKLDTKILIHGFISDGNEPWLVEMRQRFLDLENLNVIVIDWHAGAHKFYPEAVANTRVVGATVAKFIQTVQDNFKADPHQFHVIGHSLGSHVAGYVGKRTDNLGRITGLDPAGPLFEDSDVDARLDPSDAIFVDCIHSDGLPIYDLGLGTPHAWGDIDFYPNGASDQPGCPKPVSGGLHAVFTLKFKELSSDVSCSHHRAISYFLESLQMEQTCQFKAYPCSSYKDYVKGSCTSCGDGPCPVLGYHSIDSNRKGKFYLTTNAQSPFCMQK